MGKNKKRVTSSSVESYILLKKDMFYYRLGKVRIDRFHGDIYYFLPYDFFLPLNDDGYSEIRKADHLAFHASGEFHIVVEPGTGSHRLSTITHCILEVGKDCRYGTYEDSSEMRTPIQETKIQNMIELFVDGYEKLPLFKKKVDLEWDLIFDISALENKPLVFSFTIVSGKVILQNLNQSIVESPVIKLVSVPADLVIQRCLGYESGNADKLLQYSVKLLDKHEFDGPFNLRIFKDHPVNKKAENV